MLWRVSLGDYGRLATELSESPCYFTFFVIRGYDMPSFFLCHSTKDKPFVRRLARRLKLEGVTVWLDEAEINVGDSLTEKIGSAIDKTDFVGVVLSQNSVNSTWVQRELQIAMQREFKERRIVVLPLLFEPVQVPPFLRDRKYADFTTSNGFEDSYLCLLKTLGVSVSEPARPLQHKSLRRRLKKIPRWGWAILALTIPLLIILLFCSGILPLPSTTLPSPSDRLVVLIADFCKDGPHPDPMTHSLLHSLNDTLADEPGADVLSAQQYIESRESAYEIGVERQAAIVIWGTYIKTSEVVDLWIYFEVLDEPDDLPNEIKRAEIKGMSARFPLEAWERLEACDQVANELTYLTEFILGLVHYEKDDEGIDDAFSYFDSALVQVGEGSLEVVPLKKCIVYCYRGKARHNREDEEQSIKDFDRAVLLCPDDCAVYYHRGKFYVDGKDYDRALNDLNMVIALCPDYTAAYDSRGIVYHARGEHSQAIADWKRAGTLEQRLSPDQ
jgi:hypothetical protein